MKALRAIIIMLSITGIVMLLTGCPFIHRLPSGTVIDHRCMDLAMVPVSAIQNAKSSLHIAYGHTSHGSQLTTGMNGLVTFANGSGLEGEFAAYTNLFAWSDGMTVGALDLDDYAFDSYGASDLGNPNMTAWEAATRTYLNANADVNVVIWSWCGQASGASEAQIANYLSLMNQLEADYPGVQFVYMTGHLDGSGLAGNLHLRNEQIRAYCEANGKWLFDFAEIESYDPDGVWYGDRRATDGCNYDFDGDGTTEQTGDPAVPAGGDRNWATDWQAAHVQGTDWYNCAAAHSYSLNANMKAYAAWWLWARLGGWEP